MTNITPNRITREQGCELTYGSQHGAMTGSKSRSESGACFQIKRIGSESGMKEKIAFIYSGRVARYLIKERGLEPITQAINPNTGKQFTMFEKSPEFQAGMDEYKAMRKAN